MAGDTIYERVNEGDVAGVERLLKDDPSLVHARDDDPGGTPLHYATLHGHRDIAELLIRNGAEVNEKDRKWGATPKGWAVEYLLEHGALLGVQMADFIHAVKTGQVDWVRRWLERNPHYTKSYDDKGPVLDQARASGNGELVELIESALAKLR
ncbi:MAG: ankyrin repeat domain-containing protein [Candidatus Latescibacteria bacterium]|nr:ankyrin repeat domain-containing protein [Candidatus Latescibacterota bacterium]